MKVAREKLKGIGPDEVDMEEYKVRSPDFQKHTQRHTALVKSRLAPDSLVTACSVEITLWGARYAYPLASL